MNISNNDYIKPGIHNIKIILGDKRTVSENDKNYYYFDPKTKETTVKVQAKNIDKLSVKPQTVYKTNSANACSINLAATHKISNTARRVRYTAIQNVNVRGKYNNFCDIFEMNKGVITLKPGKTIPKEGVTGWLQYTYFSTQDDIKRFDEVKITIKP